MSDWLVHGDWSGDPGMIDEVVDVSREDWRVFDAAWASSIAEAVAALRSSGLLSMASTQTRDVTED